MELRSFVSNNQNTTKSIINYRCFNCAKLTRVILILPHRWDGKCCALMVI